MSQKKKKRKPKERPKKDTQDNVTQPQTCTAIQVYTPPMREQWSRQAERTAHNKRRVLDELRKSLGIVTRACSKAGVGRSQFYEWNRTDKEFAAEVKDVSEEAIDFVESQLFKSMQANDKGSVTAQIFYLKTKGKHRGYIQTHEFTGKDGVPLIPKDKFKGLRDDELEKMLLKKEQCRRGRKS